MEIPKSFLGYKRENGRAGTRNHVIILPVDDISNACAEAVANTIKGTIALPHSYGRLQFGADLELHFRTMIGTAKNPNVAAAIIIGIPIALILGIITALWRDKLPDVAISTVTIFAMTIPEFISATLLILIIAIWLEWLPGIVIVPTDVSFLELLPNIILPVVAIAMIMTAHMARMVRSSVIQVMASEYVQMAILKGVPYWKMVFKHVLPNALLPAINVVALTIAWLLGGVVVTEVVFNYPGLGRLVIESISNRDLPTVQALAIILASIYVSINLLADLLTLMLNPRLKTLQIRK